MNAQDTTPSQNRVMMFFVNAGWNIKKMSMIGRKVWIEAEPKDNETRSIFRHMYIFGTVGVRGNLELELSQVLNNQKITKDWQLANRLKD